MRLLVLGGTSFVGRHLVTTALRRHHHVTLFTRGRTGTTLFPTAERRVGDRDTGDYAVLRSGRWDAVVDLSGYQARQVEQAMDVLGDRVGRYLFVSSHAVYAPTDRPGADESLPRRTPLRAAAVLDNDTYGRCKVACEDAVLDRYGDRATLVRPGKVAGPYDPSDTVLYWVRRAAGGGKIALPTIPEQPVQLVDARDLGQFVVRLLEDGRAGAFNAVGTRSSIGQLIGTSAAVAGVGVELVPVPAQPFPLLGGEWTARQRDPARARAAGLPVTPLARTVRDILRWDHNRGLPPLNAGPSAEEERRLRGES